MFANTPSIPGDYLRPRQRERGGGGGGGAEGGGSRSTRRQLGREVEGVVMRISEEGMEREEKEKRGESDLFVGADVLSAGA